MIVTDNKKISANLFPLPNLILNPGSKLTLNIFEKRYLNLLDDCLKNKTPIALGHAYKGPQEISADTNTDRSHGYINNDPNTKVTNIPHESLPWIYSEVGFGRVKVLVETPTKTKIVLVEGLGKGRISSQFQTKGNFITAELTPIDYKDQLHDDFIFLYRRLEELTRDQVKELVKDSREEKITMKSIANPTELVAFYADHLLKDFDLRLEIFSLNDINKKINLLSSFVLSNTEKSFH